MTVPPSIDPARLLEEQLAQASPDLLRELLATFLNTLMSAQADSVCGAAYGQSSPDRTNRRNGYRAREFDTRAGTLELAVPKLRQGSYFPDWLLERRKRAERALTSVVATCYLLGVSTRRMDRLVQSLGITGLSKSQVSDMAKDLDAQVEAFRTRSLADAGPFTFLAADALVLKVREGGRVVPVHALVATGVNADGHREVLGVQVTTSEDGAGWLGFFRDLTARGLTGVKLVTSDAHAGLVAAIAATLPGAAWQRCRTHYAANLMSATPKSSWPWVHAAVAHLRVLADPIGMLRAAIAGAVRSDVESVIVFGSIARGQASRDSDIDLAVIANHGRDGRTDLEDAVRTSVGNGCDVLVFTPDEFQRLAQAGEPVVGDILRDGVALVGSMPRTGDGAA